jgi:hypothetical protein
VTDAAAGQPPGPASDAQGRSVHDPSENVKALNEAGLKRQDDLRVAEAVHIRELLALREQIATLRAEHAMEMAAKEAARIDAIRAVDRDAVTRAAEVSATQAATLAATQATSAETLRTQVEATRAANATTLAQALAPITESIELLRAAQYAQQGEKSATAPVSEQLAPILKEIADLRRDSLTQQGSREQSGTDRKQQNWSTSTTLLILSIIISLFIGIGGVIVGTGALTAPGKDVTVLPDCQTAPRGAACTSIK